MSLKPLAAGLAVSAVLVSTTTALAAREPAPAPLASIASALPPHASPVAAMRAGGRHARLVREHRRLARRLRARRAAPAVGAPPALAAIAACESGGDPRAIGGGGAYRGLYQFSAGTWAAVGGSGDPAKASPAEQTRRAAILYARSGPASWPVCGR